MNWRDIDPEDAKSMKEAKRLMTDVSDLMQPPNEEVDYDILKVKLLLARRLIASMLLTITEGKDVSWQK